MRELWRNGKTEDKYFPLFRAGGSVRYADVQILPQKFPNLHSQSEPALKRSLNTDLLILYACTSGKRCLLFETERVDDVIRNKVSPKRIPFWSFRKKGIAHSNRRRTESFRSHFALSVPLTREDIVSTSSRPARSRVPKGSGVPWEEGRQRLPRVSSPIRSLTVKASPSPRCWGPVGARLGKRVLGESIVRICHVEKKGHV